METQPLPLDALNRSGSQAPNGLDDYRVTAPREIAAMVRRLADANLPLTLVSGIHGGPAAALAATVWSFDTDRGSLGLAVDVGDTSLNTVVEASHAVAVGYVDSVKLQFDLHDRVLVRGERASVLTCAFPQELYRFQRRNAYRVRPAPRSTPVARVRHSDIPDMALALRVLDVSIGGCALFLPDDVPPLCPGVMLNQVRIELDADTRFHVDLKLQHVTSLHPSAKGARLGCEFVAAAGDTERTLQRFIDQTQKRGRLFAVG